MTNKPPFIHTHPMRSWIIRNAVSEDQALKFSSFSFLLSLNFSAHQTQVTICLSKLETLCRDVKGCHAAAGRVLMRPFKFSRHRQPFLQVKYVLEGLLGNNMFLLYYVPEEDEEKNSLEKERLEKSR